MSAIGKPGQRGLTKLFLNYRDRAVKKLKVEFSLSRELFEYITSSNCFYCGTVPAARMTTKRANLSQRATENGYYTYNGIDRVDNTKGYTVSNSVACCETCNAKKNGCTIEMARKIIDFIDRKAVL